MKAVMFDLDGTLVDVKEDYPEESLGHALRHFGLEYTKKDIYALWYGPLRESYAKTRFGFANPEEFWKVFGEFLNNGQ